MFSFFLNFYLILFFKAYHLVSQVRAFIVAVIVIIIVLHVHSRKVQAKDSPCSPVFRKVRVSVMASWPITMLEAGNKTLLKNNKNINFARLRPTLNYSALFVFHYRARQSLFCLSYSLGGFFDKTFR